METDWNLRLGRIETDLARLNTLFARMEAVEEGYRLVLERTSRDAEAIDTLKGGLAELQTRVDSVSKTLGDLLVRLKTNETRITDLETMLEGLKARVTKLEEGLGSPGDGANGQLVRAIEELQLSDRAQNEEIEKLEEEIKKLAERVDILTTLVALLAGIGAIALLFIGR
jgi:chromosome segregation ATPase